MVDLLLSVVGLGSLGGAIFTFYKFVTDASPDGGVTTAELARRSPRPDGWSETTLVMPLSVLRMKAIRPLPTPSPAPEVAETPSAPARTIAPAADRAHLRPI